MAARTRPALELIERVITESGLDASVRCVDVPDEDAARRHRFLGSPTIRVDGRDIEPGAAEREGSVRCCRIYRTESGFRGEPDERWLREALAASG